jgi:hypothetical protein
MSEWTSDDQRAFWRFKSALTRAENAKDWQAVIRCANRFEEHFVARGLFPDDWARWQVAKDDATFRLRFESCGG